MKRECSCGEDLTVMGRAHCTKHHRNFALLNGAECPECARERSAEFEARLKPLMEEIKRVEQKEIESLRASAAEKDSMLEESEQMTDLVETRCKELESQAAEKDARIAEMEARDFWKALSSSAIRTYGHLQPKEALEAIIADHVAEKEAEIERREERISEFVKLVNDCMKRFENDVDAEEFDRLDARRTLLSTPHGAEIGGHWSDCATHNMPAMPNGPFDCGGNAPTGAKERIEKAAWEKAAWEKAAGIVNSRRGCDGGDELQWIYDDFRKRAEGSE